MKKENRAILSSSGPVFSHIYSNKSHTTKAGQWRNMKRSRFLYIFIALVLSMTMFAACGTKADLSDEESSLVGRWAYPHDKETVILELNEDGTAKYEGTEYKSFNCKDGFINFADNRREPLSLRYEKYNGGIYVFRKGDYTYQGEGTPQSIVGCWKDEKQLWEFEFTDKGTFMEENAFTGHYQVNESEGTVKLMYERELQDTVFYYRLSDGHLMVEYPWQMVAAD